MKTTCPICGGPATSYPYSVRQFGRTPTCSPECFHEHRRRETEARFTQRLDEPFSEYLRRRYEEGATMTEISQEIGRSPSYNATLSRVWFPRFGIRPRKPGKKGRHGASDPNHPAFEANRARSHELLTRSNPMRTVAGKEWNASARAETLRRSPTKMELAVSEALTKAGVVFGAQHVVGPYVVDFYLPLLHLILEIDGGGWHRSRTRAASDAVRDRYLRAMGFAMVRINCGRRSAEHVTAAVMAAVEQYSY